MTTSITKQLLVIGNGMVGQHFIEQFLTRADAAQWQITVFAFEDRPAYDRVHLSEYFSDGNAEKLQLATDSFYRDNNVSLKLSEPVLAIDRAAKTVTTAKACYVYDKLVLATGSYPFVPPIAGNDNTHCLVYRTIADLEAISASSKDARVGVVIGGGLLGLEAANALKLQGLEAHVVEFAPQLMPVQLDKDGGELLRRKIEQLGVSVHTDKATSSISAGSERRLQLNFSDGTLLQTDLIVFSAGIRPQDQLGKDAGLELGARGGIVINNQCQTSDADIYAIGECALYQGQLFGLVAPGYQMARTAAAVLNGDNSHSFSGADMSTKLKLLGVDVGSI
ncbi:FAD-dependent oxidoreductase, partial [Rheinheimera sp.]|uniref:FAD-dependent oxidoreductase n=1 Tax=Rheinheimera sp. TaxID=1869214 RepID=UPI0037C8B9FA